MPAHVRSDVRHLDPVDLVVAVHRMVETVLPVHRHLRHAVPVDKQEPRLAADHRLNGRLLPVLEDPEETPEHFFRHGELPCAGIGLCRFQDVFHPARPLELRIDIDDPVLHVKVGDRQTAELGNAHPGMEQDIENLVVFAVAVVVVDELQEVPHLLPRDGFPGVAVVHHNRSELELKRVLPQDVIIDRHLECRSQDAPYRVDRAVALAVLLHLDQEQLGVRHMDVHDLPVSKILLHKEVLHEIVVRPGIRLDPGLGLKVTFDQLHHRHALPERVREVSQVVPQLLLHLSQGEPSLFPGGQRVRLLEPPAVHEMRLPVQAVLELVFTVCPDGLALPQDAVL